MSRPVTKTETLSFIPTGYSDITFSSRYYQNLDNGLAGSDSDTYARFTMRNTSYGIYYDFSVSGIPNGATITSIACAVKGYVSDANYYPSIQLYSGTTAKGSATNVISTSTSNVQNITAGSWTVAELENARLYIKVQNATTYQNRYFYFYGATLTVTYSIDTTEYEITTTVQSGSTTFSPTSQYVESGLDGVVTIDNLSDISTFSLTDNGDNVVSELVHISGNTYTYTIENISADHTLIAKTVPAHNVTVKNNSSNITSLSPPSQSITKVSQGSNFDIRFIPTNINYIDIYDNDVLVDKSTIEINSTIIEDFTTLNPSQYIQGGSGTISNTNNGLTDVSSTTYAQCGGQSTQYLIYGFDTTTIPSNATIISVECSAKVEHTHRNTTYGSVQLYYGTIAKGSASTFRATSVVNLNCGTWTREELQNVRIRIGNNYTGGTSTYYTRFYGANLTVTYEYEGDTYYIYSAPNIQGARTIRFEDKVKYNITSSSELSEISLSPASTQVYEGNNVTLEIVGITSPNAFKLKDNGTDVTSNIVPPNTYEVTTQVSGVGYGFTLNENGYYESTNQGSNNSIALARINFEFGSASEITIQYINYAEATYDYGIFGYLDISLSTSIEADSNAFKICNNSDDNSPDPQTIVYQIPAGSHFIDIKYYKDTYTGENNDSLQWKILDNQSSGSNNYTYTITNVVGNHTLRIEENTYYSVSGTSTFSGKTISGTSNKVYEGDSITLTLTGITNPYSFTLKDNGVDVTSTIVGELSNAYQITEKVSAATYGFELNDNGYYESTNKGVDNSAAVCRVNFDCSIPYEVTIQYINYAEATYDYGIFGNIDSALGTTYTADSNTFKSCNTSEDNTLTAQTLVYTIPAGSHFIDIKYRKDSGTNNSPDSLQWKILDIGPASGVTYTYTINNVSGNHTLVLDEKTKYTVTASSNYSGVTTSVSNPNPYGGESSTITINNVSDISLISIFDNGVTAITGRFSQSGTTLTYTFENISTNHSISVVEHIYYSLSITNDTESSTVTPIGTISNIDAGESYTITLETSDISIIQVTDNDINKTEDLVHVDSKNGSENLLANSYSNGNTENNFSVSNMNYIYTNSSDTYSYYNYATLTLTNTSNAVSSMFLEIDTSFLDDVPSFVDSFTVTASIRERVNSTTYVSTFLKQLYSGNTAKGTAETTTNTNTGVRTINGGTWTRNELENLRLYISATHDDSTNSASVRIYGFDVTIEYYVPEHYEYTLYDISSNHTIVFLEGAAFTMYSKDNNTWVQVSKVYKKINGIWVEILKSDSLFEQNKIYIRK